MEFKKINTYIRQDGKSFVQKILPGGRYEGLEYVVRNPIRNDKNPGSFKINTRTGRWADFAVPISGGDFISWYAYVKKQTQIEAARELLIICRF